MDLYKSICLRVRKLRVTHAHAFVHDTPSTHGYNNRAAGAHLCMLIRIHNGGPLMIYREGEPLSLTRQLDGSWTCPSIWFYVSLCLLWIHWIFTGMTFWLKKSVTKHIHNGKHAVLENGGWTKVLVRTFIFSLFFLRWSLDYMLVKLLF